MIDPDAERDLLADMASRDMYPTSIEWDAGFVKFTHPADGKSNDTGWYKVHSDGQPSGSYDWHGSPHGTVTWTYKAYKRPDNGLNLSEWRKEMKAEKKKRKKELEADFAKAARRCQTEWNNANKVDPKHPYLIAKGMQDIPVGLMRQKGNRLLCPIKNVIGGKFMSLQYIPLDGKKKLFGTGTTVAGGRNVMGHKAFKDSQLFYLCEGYATGFAIWKSTRMAVVICYSLNNLLPVAKELRKRYPKATLIIAADNDKHKKPGQNPGVDGARKYAEECDALVAIPHFNEEWDKGTPTDFNDLWMLEGEKQVRYWLDPSRASEAVVYTGDPPPPVPTDELGPELAKLAGQTWLDTAPFFCLGYDHGTYFYLPRGTGEITPFTRSQHRAEHLLGLAPGTWWENEFPGRRETNWRMAIDALYRAQEKVGVYRSERLRGRGCWREDPESMDIVLHLGDRLLPPGKGAQYQNPESYHNEKGMIYEKLSRLDGPCEDRALDLAGAEKVMEAFRGLLWYEEASGVLLAGWCTLSTICGALKWRPHVWLTGGSGAGKSTVMEDLLMPLMGGPYKHGGMNRFYEGGTTEAGIRQEFHRADALPIMYDEAENVDMKSDIRLQNVLALARSASSSAGAHTAKGSQYGKAVTYEMRSMFCLASIGGAVRQEADKTRISLLQMHSKSSMTEKQREDHWRVYAPILDSMTVTVGRELMARTLKWLRDGSLDDTIKTFRLAATGILGDTRSGDQYGTLYAGAWMLMSDFPPTAHDAREMIGSEDLDHYVVEQVPEGRKALQVLLQSRERIDTSNGPKLVAVGQLIDVVMGQASFVTPDEANGFLRQIGMKVDIEDGQYFLLVATGSEWVRKALRETPFADNIHTALRTLKGVGPGGKMRFITGMVSHTTRVPLAALMDD